MRLEVENAELKMRLAIAWGWMISKGADEEALKAVGAHYALTQNITYDQQFDVEEYMKKALKVSPEGS